MVLVSVLAACDDAGTSASDTPLTGIAAVDEEITAVEGREIADLVTRAQSGMIPGLGWPTMNDACGTIAVDDPAEVLTAFLDRGPTLYGVFEAPEIPAGVETRPPTAWVRGPYWLVYSFPLEPGAFTDPGARLHIDEDGALVGLWVGCRGVVEWMTRWDQEPLQEIEVHRPEEGDAR